MTFGHNNNLQKAFFGLPGNPVSAFVCFHIFVLPALRYMVGYPEARCKLPQISTILAVDKYMLDVRPEYARAMVSCKKGVFYSYITGEQVSNEFCPAKKRKFEDFQVLVQFITIQNLKKDRNL